MFPKALYLDGSGIFHVIFFLRFGDIEKRKVYFVSAIETFPLLASALM
jgi:hypothetical protein